MREKLKAIEKTEGLEKLDKLDVRLYFNDEGKLVDVKKLDAKHRESKIGGLEKENIIGDIAVKTGKNSPTCTYWTVINTPSGWIKICIG
ncbi:MAG: hypothetical protein ACOWWM_01245 [Desulfobacterales bacterium]